MPHTRVVCDLSKPEGHSEHLRRVVLHDPEFDRCQGEAGAQLQAQQDKVQRRRQAVEALRNHPDPALRAIAEHL